MNEAMKINNIREYMKELNIEQSESFIYVYTEPGLLSTFKYGAFASLVDLNNFLMFVLPNEVILIGLTLTGNFSDDNIIIPRKDIESFKIRKGLMQYKIKLKVSGEKQMIFRANKKILTAKWQKKNIAFLDTKYWYKS